MPTLRKGFRAQRGRPSTLRVAKDHGTPELAFKRAMGVTLEVVDACQQNGWLTDGQVRTALHFRWLYTLRFGAPTVQCTDMTGHARASPIDNDTQWRADRQREYRVSAGLLEARGLLDSVLRGVVFNDPTLLHPKRMEAKLLRHRLAEGLAALGKLRDS